MKRIVVEVDWQTYIKTIRALSTAGAYLGQVGKYSGGLHDVANYHSEAMADLSILCDDCATELLGAEVKVD